MDQRSMASMQAMMYGGAPPQQGQGGQQQSQEGAPLQPDQQPGQQQQQPNMQGYPGFFPGAMPNYFQSQTAAAHATAAMAEQHLSGMGEQQGGYGAGYGTGYGTGGGGYAGGYPAYGPGGDSSQDYMEANRLLMARLHQQQQQQGGAPGGWMPMQYGYGMGSPQQDAYAENGMLGPWSTTSAGLLSRIGGTDDKKKSVRKKHKDKPKRPLSAYNLFFKDERAIILAEITAARASEGEKEEVKKESLLEDEEGEDGNNNDDERTKGRKGKKAPHGKIGFESLAKTIGQRWQKLEGERMEKYKKLAAEDMTRYKKQMEVFLTKLEREKKQKGGGQYVGEEDEYGEPASKKTKTEEESGDSEV
jgi:hypothetical protein